MGETVGTAIEIAKKFISENFAPIGETSQKEHITSAEIVYQLREMVTASTMEITQLMSDAKFEVEFIDGLPYWVVYVKRHRYV